MINVVYGGDTAFDAILYPQQNPTNDYYIQNQLAQFGSTLSDVGRNFMEASRAVYDKLNSSEAMRLAQAAIRAAKGLFHPNQIVPLETLEQLQNAQPIMQRWVMSCPEIRELYHAQRCNGYDGTYVDVSPAAIGEGDYNYRRVMDQVIVETDDDWYVRIYSDDLLPGDRELTTMEKVDILSTWDIVRLFVNQNKDDPTNPWGGSL